jgi:hypothetical protein
MRDDRVDRGEQKDQAWPGAFGWDLGAASGHTSETLWRCEALRAGRLYQSTLFATREEAEEFALKMQQAEPDQMFNVEAIKASTIWN